MTRVSNIVGANKFNKPKGYNSWLGYWENHSKIKKIVCGTSGCSNTNLVGAHVRKSDQRDNSNYITPICKECSKRTDEFDVHWMLIAVAE